MKSEYSTIFTYPHQLINQISNIGVFKRYLLLGSDFSAKKKVTNYLSDNLINPKTHQFDRILIWADEKDAFSRLLEAISTPPVDSKKKIILVYNTEKLLNRNYQDKLPVLEFSSDLHCVVFLSDSGESKNFRKSRKTPALIKCLSEISQTAIFLDPFPNQRKDFIQKLTESYNLTLSSDQISKIDLYGPSTAAELNLLMEQLSIVADSGGRLNLSDILASQDSIDILSYNIANRDYQDSFASFDNAVNWGHRPGEILAVLSKYFNLLNAVKPHIELGNGFAIQKKLLQQGVYITPELANRLSYQTRYWSKTDIKKARELMYKTMISIRLGKIQEKLAVLTLINDIMAI